MRTREEMLMNRRELFRTSLRLTALGGLAVLGFIALKRDGKRDGRSDCINHKICRDCRILDRCAFPEAETARRQQARR
jgi:hypothetical protein